MCSETRFPFILALWAFIFPYFAFLGGWSVGSRHKLQKTVHFLEVFKWDVTASGLRSFLDFVLSFDFGFLGLRFLSFSLFDLHFLSFWPFEPSFPLILGFWVFISFHFVSLGFHFLTFWSFGPSFPVIFGRWVFIFLHFLSFCSFLGFLIATLWGENFQSAKAEG